MQVFEFGEEARKPYKNGENKLHAEAWKTIVILFPFQDTE